MYDQSGIMHEIFRQFGIDSNEVVVIPQFSGLINKTWRINGKEGAFILQRINTDIFPSPGDIAQNIQVVGEHLRQHHPDYLFVQPLPALDGSMLVSNEEGTYRLFPFISDSHTIEVVETPEQAYEAARAFGKFSRLLSDLDAEKLNITLPRFHDLHLRFQQFEDALRNKNFERIQSSSDLVLYLLSQRSILDEYDEAMKEIRIRVTHHDTKISNVLFDAEDKALCVIDLDTLMPGHFISDLGDMMRTYLSPANEEEKDLSKISIRKIFYHAIVDGYLSEMGEELNAAEKKYIAFSGRFMIYMQALRFLTDHLNNDTYYGARYSGHNYVRALNQANLYKQLKEFEGVME